MNTHSEITGAGGLVAKPAAIGVESSAHQFLGAARDFYAGAEYMAQAPDGAGLWRSCAFVGAQALECVLKSYLSHRGVSDTDLKKTYHHDLDHLWRGAVSYGLGIEKEPPQWCSRLNDVHNEPLLRYPSRTNGYVLPSMKAVEAELKKLIGMVESAIT